MLLKLLSINFVRTLYFNLIYFGIREGLKFPVIIGRGVRFVSLKGAIEIKTSFRTGLVVIKKNELDLHGKWIINGETRLNGGTDSKVFVGQDGVLETGSKFYTNGSVEINCVKSIRIGNGCLFAHKIEILDTDFHDICSLEGIKLNDNRSILIGERVWVGSNTLILKGTKVAADCVIAAGSVLTSEYDSTNCIYGGIPAKVIRRDIKWAQ